MRPSKVMTIGGGRYVVCQEGDEGAVEAKAAGSMYGIPPWLTATGWVRLEPNATSGETWTLSCVSSTEDVDDPNRDFAQATPSGSLTLYVQNPDCFGYVETGREYRVTIERIRGPRDA
jgi:hypothetical protein